MAEQDKPKFDALNQELIRQELEDYKESLKEKEKLIQLLEKGQQNLEDQLEDANAEIDRLNQEIDRYRMHHQNFERIRSELEKRCKRLEQKLYQVGYDGTVTRLPELDNLKDQRLHPPKKTVSFFSALTWPFLKSFFIGIALGSGLLLLILEIVSFARYHQEFFGYFLD